MNTPTPKVRRTLLLALSVITIGISYLWSQNPTAKTTAMPSPGASDDWVHLTFASVKPDKILEFNRLQKEEVIPALKQAGVTVRRGFTPGMFAEYYTFVFGRPFKSFAEFDEQNELVKALGRDAANALTEKLRACLVRSQTFAVRNFPDLSWAPRTPLAKTIVTEHELAPGRKAEWLAFMRQHYVPAVRSTGAKSYIVQETVFGGSTNQVYTLTGFDRYADLDGGGLKRKLGDEAYAKLMEKLPAGVVLHSQRWLSNYRPDLSIGPEAKP
ncbi:MAG: hypothetical protein Q7S40_06005 [Opitutaceae bacterium]|nr:hypothetical protein [Opitutaceae bacterium]